MVAVYQELQPVDSYKIQLSHPISDYDRQLLTLFYQPLIGSSAMSLFMTLWADAEQEDDREYTHYYLMNLLSMPLDPIFEARISLEAIGLLRTYVKKDGDARSFRYKLYSPLGAKEFFNDPLLSTFLFSKIGEQPYRNLRARFAVSTTDTANDENFRDVSRTFLDVYKPVTNGLGVDEGADIIDRNQSDGVPFVNYDFDFNLLKSGLSEQMVPQAALTSVPKEIISKLAFLYSLTPLDMQKVVMMALDEDMQLPDARLRRAAADYYKMSISKEAPLLQKVFVKPQPETTQKENLSREDELLYYLENTAPVDMLRDLNDKEPLSVDVQLAERLINTHSLPIGVVNVLLQYVHIRNDGKITNNYVERIASHWMNKKVSTAKEALEFSRKEHDKYMQWKDEGQKPASNNRRGSGSSREAMVPEWFFKKDEKKEQPKKVDPDVEERRRKLLKNLNARRTEVK